MASINLSRSSSEVGFLKAGYKKSMVEILLKIEVIRNMFLADRCGASRFVRISSVFFSSSSTF